MTKTIQLQSIGNVPAVEASELRVGDLRMYNFGSTALVVKVIEKSAKTLQLITFEGGKYYMSDIRKTTLVSIAKRDQDVSEHQPKEAYNVSGKEKGMVDVSAYFQTEQEENIEEIIEVVAEHMEESTGQETEQPEQELNVTMSINEEMNGIELKFTDKPSEELRNQLKANGFKWSRNKGIWYAKQNAERLIFAESLTGSAITETTYNNIDSQEISYPEIEINDLESEMYNVSQELQDREHDSHWITRTQKMDHNKVLFDLFAEYQSQVLELIETTDNDYFIFKLKEALQRFKRKYHATYTKYLSQKASQPSWIVTGRGGLNASRYNKRMDQQDKTLSELVCLPKEMERTIIKYSNKIKKEKKSA